MTNPSSYLRRLSPTLLTCALLPGFGLAAAASAQDAPDFEKDVWPILRDHCVVCHGPVDDFGDMRLDTKEGILKGGEDGKVVLPGDPDKSPIVVRTSLPADDLDVMPAEGDPLTPEQVDVLRRWIAAGAEFGDWEGI